MKFYLFLFLLIPTSLFANETCSRVAIINYQEILVDAGSGKRGEGLRFYLEKDPVSKELLDTYQKKNKPTVLNASASTLGSIMILSGILQTSEAGAVSTQNTLIYGGSLLIAVSYLAAKTMKYNNEKYLKQAVDQYNKRNSPRIYFSPYRDDNGQSGVGFGLRRNF